MANDLIDSYKAKAQPLSEDDGPRPCNWVYPMAKPDEDYEPQSSFAEQLADRRFVETEDDKYERQYDDDLEVASIGSSSAAERVARDLISHTNRWE